MKRKSSDLTEFYIQFLIVVYLLWSFPVLSFGQKEVLVPADGTVSEGEEQPVVALTFDDGPSGTLLSLSTISSTDGLISTVMRVFSAAFEQPPNENIVAPSANAAHNDKNLFFMFLYSLFCLFTENFTLSVNIILAYY